MTLVLKLDLDIVKMYVCTKMKLLPLMVQKLQPEQIHTQTDRQTDSTEIITYPHMQMVTMLIGLIPCCALSIITFVLNAHIY